MGKAKDKAKAREFREIAIGYCYGPYDGHHMSVDRVTFAPRDASMRQLINIVRRNENDTGWVATAWRRRDYWEWSQRVQGGKDLRLVARLVKKKQHNRKDSIPIYSED